MDTISVLLHGLFSVSQQLRMRPHMSENIVRNKAESTASKMFGYVWAAMFIILFINMVDSYRQYVHNCGAKMLSPLYSLEYTMKYAKATHSSFTTVINMLTA